MSSRDGSIDFSKYSLAQLEELRDSIDQQAFPQNFSNLLAELERRHQAQAKPQVDEGESGRFTSRQGLLGWLQAKRKRLPVYGTGSVEITDDAVVLQGWQRTWLGVPQQAVVAIPITQIRNVGLDRDWVRFEWKRPWRRAKPVEFQPQVGDRAPTLAARLPGATTGMRRGWAEMRDFQRRATAITPRIWATPALVLANLLVYLSMAVATRRLGAFDLQQMLAWGANYGPLTVGGQWWRLLSATFLHANLAHILLNMWAFWNVGRLAERLYGKWMFLFLYLASGVLGSLSSIAWNPSQVSVGASGAIFGIFGAFLAFLVRRRSEMPAAMLRAHWISTLAFVVFNLVSGVLQTGIDNAAHFGGLTSGFALGWVLARPLTVEIRSDLPFKEGVAAVLLCAAAVIGGLWQVQGLESQLAPNERFLRTHAWYVKGEAEDLRRWQALASQAGAGTISDAELGRQFERDILPFWTTSEKRLHDEAASIPPNQRPFASLVSEFVHLRSDWARAVIDATKNRDANRAQDAQKLSVQTVLVQARLERMGVRSGMDHRARALSNGALVVGIRGLFSKRSWTCIEPPPVFGTLVGPSDAPTDGPAARDKAGCLAQSLFMSENYAALDALISHATTTLGDLPDGGSTISGIFGGLSDLFEYGAISIDEALVRTADWRRQVVGSLEPDLVEALIFESWAWGVRGHGSAPEVSQQAWAIFAYRTEMADASLEGTKALAAANPYWYQLSLSIGLDKSVGVDELRSRFDRGVKRFPGYLPIYRAMLRILMPRWLGSYQKVAEFIGDASTASGDDVAMYARLYWMYDLLEQDDVDIFTEASANWTRMKIGFEELRWLYPHSDVVLNAFARFACIADDEAEYSALRPSLIGHVSATAWTAKVSLKTCDANVLREPPALRPPRPAARPSTAG